MAARILAGLLAIIGISGELLLLRHDLVDCYPFKMMSYPPGEFYERMGNEGMIALLVPLVLCALVLARKRPRITPAVMTVVAPLACVAVVAGFTWGIYGFEVPAGVRNFDGYRITTATGELFAAALGLSVGGLVIGGICGALLSLLERRRMVSAAA